MFYYVYVLQSQKDQSLCIGYTSNLKRRFKEHTQGKGKHTKNLRLLELIYYEAHRVKENAQKREKYFKTTKGKRTLKIMLN